MQNQNTDEVNDVKGPALSLVILMLAVMFVTGCTGTPEQEIADARAAVDTAFSEGAEKYAPEEAKKLYDTLSAAEREIRTQEKKLIRNYQQAREMLSGIRADAEALRQTLPARKEAARKKALAAHAAATSALQGTRSILAQMPKPKTEDPGENPEDEISALAALLDESQQLIAHEDFNAASAKADDVKNRSVLLADRMKKTFDKSLPKRRGSGDFR